MKGKSRDSEYFLLDIFREGVIRKDLLLLMNQIKEQTYIPESMKGATITMLHKKKNKLDLKNWRGIFVCSVLRTILMKMLHKRTYEVVAQNMTDSQIGAKKKSVRNHLCP